MVKQKEWPLVALLAGAGIADSAYLLLYQTGQIKHLVCPIFGEGCEKVSNSPAAYRIGIPNAMLGVMGYTAAAATAIVLPKSKGVVRKALAWAAIGGSAIAMGLSAYLTYAQPKKAGAWCFWCLASAAISFAMAPLAIKGARSLLRETGQGRSNYEISSVSGNTQISGH